MLELEEVMKVDKPFVEGRKNIYEAMSAVMEDCGFVGKDSTNEIQKYKYRGIDAVMNALNPAFRKNKVFVVPEVLEQTREERINAKGTLLIYSIVKVRYTFYTEDGSYVQATVSGEGMDSGDKSLNKAMSAAFKYALFQTLCIPTEEMKDSEIDSPEPMPKKGQKMTDRERAAAAYPPRQEMIDFCVKNYDDDNMGKLLNFYKVTTLEELDDTALQVCYARKYNDLAKKAS